MSDVIRDLLDNCKKERDALRAELAAERKRREEGFELARQWEIGAMRYKAERDELRALLREARTHVDYRAGGNVSLGGCPAIELLDRIDRALKGDGDE